MSTLCARLSQPRQAHYSIPLLRTVSLIHSSRCRALEDLVASARTIISSSSRVLDLVEGSEQIRIQIQVCRILLVFQQMLPGDCLASRYSGNPHKPITYANLPWCRLWRNEHWLWSSKQYNWRWTLWVEHINRFRWLWRYVECAYIFWTRYSMGHVLQYPTSSGS